MNSKNYDVAIIGLGAMGSASAYHLARRGLRVIGFDRHSPPHDQGSSHGETRIIREAYAEGVAYVKIVQRAYELWAELEEESGRDLYLQTGGMMFGSDGSDMIAGAETSAVTHNLTFEKLSMDEVRHRYKIFNPDVDMTAIFDPRSGILYPESCVEAHLELGKRHGAELLFGQPAVSWDSNSDSVTVRTENGAYTAQFLILAAGSWLPQLLNGLEVPLQVERQVLMWYEPTANQELFRPENCPIFIWDTGPGIHFYGFPDLGTGVKVARMHFGDTATPENLRRDADADDDAPVRSFLEHFMPDVPGKLLSSQVCMFTNTPDEHFLIDIHPEYGNVVIASPCSGHGFKFASAMGEILADLATTGKSNFDISMFGLDRFDNINEQEIS